MTTQRRKGLALRVGSNDLAARQVAEPTTTAAAGIRRLFADSALDHAGAM
jgi:hypothetical protein